MLYCADVNECESNPCGNSGTCTDEVNRYTCKCVAGLTGSVCETSTSAINTRKKHYDVSFVLTLSLQITAKY